MATAHVLVRVWLPDRPGALGQVASRIGSLRGDIVGVDVLECDGGVAIDEFALNLADEELVPMLVREIEEVDGASVEEVRVVNHFPDPRLDALNNPRPEDIAVARANVVSAQDRLDRLINPPAAEVDVLRANVAKDLTALLKGMNATASSPGESYKNK